MKKKFQNLNVLNKLGKQNENEKSFQRRKTPKSSNSLVTISKIFWMDPYELLLFFKKNVLGQIYNITGLKSGFLVNIM